MKKIQVLGGGCSKCTVLAEDVTEVQKIMEFGVMTTPALVVDGQVKFSGKVLKAEALKDYLK